MKKVHIIGGGIAAIEAAISLRKQKIEVSLITDREYLFIYPMAIWVPVGDKNFDELCIDMYELAAAHGFSVLIDEVVGIAASKNTIFLKNSKELLYDYLIIATGSDRIEFDGIENCVTICGKPEDVITTKEAIDRVLSKGSGSIAAGFAANPFDSSGVRGGPAFEFIFNLHNSLKKKSIRKNFELLFFAPMQKPAEGYGEKISNEIDKLFSRLKISTHFGKNIQRFEKNGVVFEDNSSIYADVVMFISGRRGLPFLKNSDIPLSESGFVKINEYCQVEGFDGLYAVGDAALLDGPEWRIKQGRIAEIMAKTAAFNIFSIENGSDARESYIEQMRLIYMLDIGGSSALLYRKNNSEFTMPMSFVGSWLKKGWGRYYRLSRLGKIPRVPGD